MSARPRPLQVDVRNAVRSKTPSVAAMRRWLQAAAGAAGRDRVIAVSIVGSAEGQRLNTRWRARAKPTNVLSFGVSRGAMGRAIGGASGGASGGRVSGTMRRARGPAAVPYPLGDLVLCAPVIAREAREQGKPLFDHWAHLLVHGALHLLGHDHQKPGEAARMERRERRILAHFGIPDPYRGTMSPPES